jgi:hypothetical protein
MGEIRAGCVERWPTYDPTVSRHFQDKVGVIGSRGVCSLQLCMQPALCLRYFRPLLKPALVQGCGPSPAPGCSRAGAAAAAGLEALAAAAAASVSCRLPGLAGPGAGLGRKGGCATGVALRLGVWLGAWDGDASASSGVVPAEASGRRRALAP